MDTNAAPVVSPLPDNISASGARRVDPDAAHQHTKASLPSEDAGDPLDGLREQSLRKETGQAARYHERLDHAAARAAKQVDTPENLKHVRRAGFGSMSACPALARTPRAPRFLARVAMGLLAGTMRRPIGGDKARRMSTRCAEPPATRVYAACVAVCARDDMPAMRSRARRRCRRPRGAPGGSSWLSHQD